MALSPFLNPGTHARPDKLAILHLRRDSLIPTLVSNGTPHREDAVTNTRFGSYPHSTFANKPWGSQIPASKVDNSGRGRKAKKRKLDSDAVEDTDAADDGAQQLFEQASGFCHVLPPTPETWTISLPHRTQVVYTPDYSFVLQKMRARPGSVLIEAGAGSGSFTHAAARAVYNGEPCADGPTRKRCGKVYSFEYHEQRAVRLAEEVKEHGLDSIVTVTHRDVYENGFCLDPADAPEQGESPKATNVFLDLPDPPQALPHLARHPPRGRSPLDPDRPVYLTCFLPCIEQVIKCVESLRKLQWVEISMYEVAHKRLDVRREQVGLHLEGLRGVTAVASSIEESIARLKEVEQRQIEFNAEDDDDPEAKKAKKAQMKKERETKTERLSRLAKEAESRKMWREGRLTFRTEPDLKTHTSYLIFATLPPEWSAEDEAKCRAAWPVDKAKEDGA